MTLKHGGKPCIELRKANMNINGYVCVSDTDQNADRQLAAMDMIGVAKVNVFADKRSGKDFERPQY